MMIRFGVLIPVPLVRAKYFGETYLYFQGQEVNAKQETNSSQFAACFWWFLALLIL
jgi:hypothetical protein